jgi:hypothetical protein
MFTLNRLPLIGLGAALAVVGCASPTDETADPIDQTSAALTEEVNPEQATNEETALSAEEREALDAQAQPDEGTTESRSDAIMLGGWGGGFGPWGGGFYRGGGFYGGGLGVGVPFIGTGFYGGVPYGGLYGAGVVPGIGWGGVGFGGGCLYGGCGRMWW